MLPSMTENIFRISKITLYIYKSDQELMQKLLL